MAGDVQIMESTGKNTRRERNRRTPVQPPKKEHKISLMKVGISFLIVIALVLGSVSVVTVIKNREIHLSNFYDKSNAVFGIEKVQFNANRAAAFSENLCVPDGTEDDSSLNLTSGAAGSFDLASGEVDYAQNIFNKMYPASITKVMTALVTLKNCSLDETVTVGEECQEEIKILIGYMNHTLKQNILTSIEQEDYVHQMEALCEQLYENAREKLEVTDYSFLLQRLIEQKFYEEAEKWAERFMTQYPDELKPYTLCMKLYFEMEQKEKFFEVLDKLRASSIVIDNQTLELIRIVQR